MVFLILNRSNMVGFFLLPQRHRLREPTRVEVEQQRAWRGRGEPGESRQGADDVEAKMCM